MSQPRKKSFVCADTKTVDAAQGICEHIVSVFDNVDHAGERIKPGFFTKSIQRKLPKGVWAHDWTKPVAKTLEARELLAGDPLLPDAIKNLGGLYVKVQYNLGTERGRDAFSDVSGGYVDEFSIGFTTTKQKFDSVSGITDLIEGDLYEWSPVLVGCNPLTQQLSAKSFSPGTVHLKSVLGDWMPEQMTMAAISHVYDAILYVLYDCVFNYHGVATVEERVQTVQEACAEFGDACGVAMRALLTDITDSSDDTSEAKVAEFGAQIKSLMREPHPRFKAAESQSRRRAVLKSAILTAARIAAKETE